MDAGYRSAKSRAWEPVELVEWRGGTTPRIADRAGGVDGKVVIKRELLPDGRQKLIVKDPATGDFSDRSSPPAEGLAQPICGECRHRARRPGRRPRSSAPIDSREKSWSTTIDDAPMTPARPPSDERWMSRSRVASGSERR